MAVPRRDKGQEPEGKADLQALLPAGQRVTGEGWKTQQNLRDVKLENQWCTSTALSNRCMYRGKAYPGGKIMTNRQ